MQTAGCSTVLAAIVLCCLAARADGSAIPMWEFLSRDEKMSHLYRVFSKQVARYCSDSPMPDCNKNLLVAGLRNLVGMDENFLDRMDPYQRGAKDIIWRAMISNDRFSTRVGDRGQDEYYGDAAVDPLETGGGEHNGLAEESAPTNDYVRPSEHTGPYLVGPMVIRVFPDGRPVPGDSKRPLPRDEDVDDLKFSRLPSVEEIESSSGGFFYGKSTNPSKRPYYSTTKSQHGPTVIPTTKGIHRRANPLFAAERRIPDASDDARTIRFVRSDRPV